MEIVDFAKYEKNLRFYGGASGQKYGIVIDNEDYILKFPQNIKEFKLLYPTSYSTNAFSEFLGSHFYEYMGLPVHETILGKMGKHHVVACKDFCKDEYILYEFGKLANALVVNDELPSPSKVSTNKGIILSDVLSVIDNLPQIEFIRDALRERFWEMFIIDALIANPDRNNGNWGILIPIGSRNITSAIVAPVFDNGNSLNAKLSEKAIKAYQQKNFKEKKDLCLKTASIFQTIDEKGEVHKINPYAFIQQEKNKDCTKALIRLKNRIPKAIKQFEALVDSIPELSDAHKDFYKESINIRYKEGVLPFFAKAQLKETDGLFY